MTRYNLTQEQINLLDFDEIENLRKELNQELMNLNQTEWKLYTRRLELELIANPELGIREPIDLPQKPKTKLDLYEMMQGLVEQGYDIKSLLKST